jgi:hypothetical protein
MADIFARNGFRPAEQESQSRKWGEGHASAMFRLGLTELRNAANPSRESVADREMGLYGTVSPGTAAEQQGHLQRPVGKDQERERGL